MQTLTVGEAMSDKLQIVRADLSADLLEAEFDKTDTHGLLVVDDDGLLCGIVTLQDLGRARERGGVEGRTVGDISTHDVVTVTPDDSLAEALAMVSAKDYGRLPVVDTDSPRRLVGLLRRRDIIRAYDIALQRKLDERHTQRQIRLAAYSEGRVLDLQVKPGSQADGHSISQLPWPEGSIVAAIKRRGHMIVPHGSTVLLAGDWLTLMAGTDDETVLRSITSKPQPETTGQHDD
jgi:CIC family chloride channel protein